MLVSVELGRLQKQLLLSSEQPSGHHPHTAPTKEQVSLRTYSVTRRLNRLRHDACLLFTSDAFVKMTQSLEREITNRRIALRSERNVFADLGSSTGSRGFGVNVVRKVIVIMSS